MNGFLEKSRRLRIEVIDYIADYLKKVNRNIVVPKGNLTYIDWDYAEQSNDDNVVNLVPETEIVAICLDSHGQPYFINTRGEEVHQGNLDTEELIYVADFIDELILFAPLDEESK